MTSTGMVKKEQPKGPMPLSAEDLAKREAEIHGLEEKRRRLKEEAQERALGRDVELKEAKRVAAESRVKVEEIKTEMSKKLAEQGKEHKKIRDRDATNVAGYVKRLADNRTRIGALEKELAALKAAAAAEALP